MSDELVVGYWQIRGLAQPIRTMMAYSNVNYNLKEYRMVKNASGQPNDLDGWFSVKPTLGLTYPNLPYLTEGNLKLTESNAILGYLGEKCNLHGTTPAERALVVMHAEFVMGFRNAFVKLVYGDSATYLANKKNYFDKQQAANKNAHFYLSEFESVLGGKQWLLGDRITFPDFHLYEMLFAHCKCNGDETLDSYPNLKSFQSRFLELPGIAEVEEKTKHLTINSIFASFTGGE